MKTVIVTQARYGSSRFPGKVLKKIGDEPLLKMHLSRLKKVKNAEQVLVATTNEPEALEIVAIASALQCAYYQGSLHDVLDRFFQSVKGMRPDVVVRVTSDCPLNDPGLIDQMLDVFAKSNFDYFSNVHPPTFPDGVDIEIFTFSALERAWKEATLDKDREHVTHYFYTHPEIFKIGNFSCEEGDYSSVRLTVDYSEDFDVIKALVEKLGSNQTWKKYVDELEDSKSLLSLNKHRNRNEGF